MVFKWTIGPVVMTTRLGAALWDRDQQKNKKYQKENKNGSTKIRPYARARDL